jgi:tetratricopeptide (TPR) repeat protein
MSEIGNSKLEVVRLFIASPGDLTEERALFPGLVQLLNDVVGHRMQYQLEALGWEDALPGWGRPQALINQDVSTCDVFVMLLWKRWGMPSGRYTSGTEEEFEIAYERYRKSGRTPHLLLYFRSVPLDMMADPGDQLQKVIAFRTRIEVERIGLFKAYDTPYQWKDFLMRHVSEWLYNRVDGITYSFGDTDKIQVPIENEAGIIRLHQTSQDESPMPETTESKRRREAIGHAVDAMALISEGKLTLAEQSFAKSVELYEEPEVLNNFGLFLYQIGSLDRAKALFEKVLLLSTEEKGDVHQATAYSSLGDVYLTRGSLDVAQEMYEKSLRINTTLAREEGMADQFGKLGVVYTVTGELDLAEQMHGKALEIDTRIGRKEGRAIAFSKLGNVYVSRGNFEKAREMYESALEIDKILGREAGMAKEYLGLGNVQYVKNDFDNAEQSYGKALEINIRIGRKEGMADAYGSFGNLSKSRGDLDQATESYLKALDIDASLGRLAGMANSYGNLGLLHVTRGNFDSAEELLKKALEIDEGLGRKEGIADDYDNLAAMYAKKGDLVRANGLWLKALGIYEDLTNVTQIERVRSLLKGLAAKPPSEAM